MKIINNEEVVERLDVIIKLLAMKIMSDEGTQKDRIIQLGKLGMKPKQIAIILSTTSNYVNKTLSIARKEGLL